MVPPLFIQPLVENSIKHGILPRQSIDSKIELNVHETGDLLTIEVRDNGVGFSKAKEKANKSHVSFGLENIRNRVEQLSMILGKKIEFSMEERMEETGQWTVVSIKMHL
jgi:LytS/YehU family sensor histidine kinase